MNECQYLLVQPSWAIYPSVTLPHPLDMGGLCKKRGLYAALMWAHGLKSQIMLQGSSADKDLGVQVDSRALLLCPALAKLHLERGVQCSQCKRGTQWRESR